MADGGGNDLSASGVPETPHPTGGERIWNATPHPGPRPARASRGEGDGRGAREGGCRRN